jgi:L-lactate dehydrogenase (cytochrome)
VTFITASRSADPVRRTVFDIALHPGWWFNLLSTEPLQFAVFSETDGTRRRVIDRVFDPPITPADLAWIRDDWMGRSSSRASRRSTDACLVVDAARMRSSISNHGGRQLDRAPTPLEQLPSSRPPVGDRARSTSMAGSCRVATSWLRSLPALTPLS